MSDRKFILYSAAFGFILFLISVFINLPARFVTQFIPAQAPVSLNQVSGSLWSGQANSVVVQNIPLGRLDWQLSFWSLLTGNLSIDTQLQADQFNAKGNISINIAKRLSVKNMSINANSSALLELAQLPNMVSGQLHASIEHLAIADISQPMASLPTVQASLQWADASVTYSGQHTLGTYAVNLRSEPASGTVEKIHLEYNDQQAALGLSGNSDWLANGQYNTLLKLSPQPALSPTLKNFLPYLGKADAKGQITVQRKGKISDVISWLNAL